MAGERQIRDRHGRGPRGPAFGVGPLAPRGVPARIFGAERFDAVALAVMQDVVDRGPEELGRIDLAVEEIPLLPQHWNEASVPLAAYVDPTSTQAGRLVLFRRPIERRTPSRMDLQALLLTVIVEQLAEVFALNPEDLHPGYDPE